MRWMLSWALLLVALASPAWVHAQAEGENEQEARAQFEVGRRLYELGQFQEAAEAFDRAYRSSPRPELLMNMYTAYRDAAMLGPAADALERYLASDAVPPADRPVLERRLRALRADSTEPEAEGPSWIAPGLLLGGAGALVVAGTVTGVLTAAEHGQLEAECPAMTCSTDEAHRLDTIRALSITTDILLPLGAAVGTAGLVWLLVELTSQPGQPGQEDPVTPQAACGLRGCVVEVRGTF